MNKSNIGPEGVVQQNGPIDIRQPNEKKSQQVETEKHIDVAQEEGGKIDREGKDYVLELAEK